MVNEMKGQQCPMCLKKTLVLIEEEMEIPFFGKCFVFSMKCENCKFFKSDVESVEQKEGCKYTLEVNGEEDLKIRIVKSSEATVKIPHISTITPGPAAQGYVTNVEGILNRVKEQIESLKNDAEENSDRKKAKNLLKKIQRVLWGRDKLKIIIEDPSGNSAIISEKTVKGKL